MDWNDLLLYVLEGIASIAIAGLSTLLTIWINKHIKNETAKKHALELEDLITKAVLMVKQTYVDTLKKEGKFDAEAQQLALTKALQAVEGSMSDELKQWVSDTFGDLTKYLTTLIEAQVSVSK